MSDVAQKMISAIAEHGDIKFLMAHPELADYLADSQLDAVLFGLLDQHVNKFGKVPALATLEEQWGEKIQSGPEPASFYLDAIRKNHVRKTLIKANLDAQAVINQDPEEALARLEKACLTLRRQRQGLASVDLRESLDMVLKHLTQKLVGSKLTFGWETLDSMSGGMLPGDFDVLVGRRGLGKTFALLSRAFHFWENLGKKVVFLSMEMSLQAILERAVSIYAEIPADYMKQGLLPNVGAIDFKKKLVKALEEAKTRESGFWLFDGAMVAGQEDVYRIVSQIEPDVVCADAPYLMAGSSYADRWQKIAESATFLKLAIAPRAPVMATFQFTSKSLKEAKKGKNIADPDDLDIAGSQEIGNLASVILGLFQAETPEALNRRKVTVLKGRYGETGTFEINWDFIRMCFDEYIDADDPYNIT